MKSLLIISARLRSGSTTLTCLLARYLLSVGHRRVLVLDLADPPWCARLIDDEALPHGYAWLLGAARVECVGDAGSGDAAMGEATRTVTACLKVITRRLDAIPGEAAPVLRQAETRHA